MLINFQGDIYHCLMCLSSDENYQRIQSVIKCRPETASHKSRMYKKVKGITITKSLRVCVEKALSTLLNMMVIVLSKLKFVFNYNRHLVISSNSVNRGFDIQFAVLWNLFHNMKSARRQFYSLCVGCSDSHYWVKVMMSCFSSHDNSNDKNDSKFQNGSYFRTQRDHKNVEEVAYI